MSLQWEDIMSKKTVGYKCDVCKKEFKTEKSIKPESIPCYGEGAYHTNARVVMCEECSTKIRIYDGIYGLAVGDALGVPFENMQRDSFHCTDMVGFGMHSQPEGTWSDDTSLALATQESIMRQGKIDIEDIRQNFERWFFQGAFTPFGKVFDCGYTCSTAIIEKKGQNTVNDNGNGSLMRILPLAFVDGITNRQIRKVSAITHGHKIAKQCCVAYVRIAKELAKGVPIAKAIKRNLRYIPNKKAKLLIFNGSREDINSGGFVVDTLISALWCLYHTNRYRECVLAAINLGGDTDTTAAVAGGLAGIVYGIKNIPSKWLENLKGKQIIEDCITGIGEKQNS